MRNKVPLFTEDIVCEGERAWFFAKNLNGLYEMNLENGEVHFCGYSPFDILDGERLFVTLKKYDDKIFLIPFNALNFVIYNCITCEFTMLNLPFDTFQSETTHFMASVMVDEYIYAFGAMEGKVLKINCQTCEVKVYDKWVKDIGEYNKEDAFFRNQVVVVNEKIYAPLVNANAVLELDILKDEIIIHRLSDGANGYVGICFEKLKDYFWLVPRKLHEPVVCCDRKFHVVEKAFMNCVKTLNSAVAIYCQCGKTKLYLYNGSVQSEMENDAISVADGKYNFALEQDDIFIKGFSDKSCIEIESNDVVKQYVLEVLAEETVYPLLCETKATEETKGWGVEELVRLVIDEI